jgi:hypothetical protein
MELSLGWHARLQGCWWGEVVLLIMLQGILGQGSGKALEAKSAVDKATRKALKHLTYVPRFRDHTIHYPITVLYGKTKVRLGLCVGIVTIVLYITSCLQLTTLVHMQ